MAFLGRPEAVLLVATPDDVPAFILGLPRSGTTVLSYALNTHPEIAVPPEPWVLLALEALGEVSAQNLAGGIDLSQAFREFVAGTDLSGAKRAFAIALYQAHLRKVGKRIFIDKTPRYWLKIDQIHDMFPDARYIWLRRNPFAVLSSMKASWRLDLASEIASGGDNSGIFDLAIGSRVLNDFAARQPRHLLIVSYENFVEDPLGETSRIFNFLGARPFAIDRQIDAARAGYNHSHVGDKKILQTGSFQTDRVHAWKTTLTGDELQQLYDLLGPELIADLGYAHILGEIAIDRDEKQQRNMTAELRTMVTEAFEARKRDVERFCSIDTFDPDTDLAVRIAYRDPRRVLRALGMLKGL